MAKKRFDDIYHDGRYRTVVDIVDVCDGTVMHCFFACFALLCLFFFHYSYC